MGGEMIEYEVTDGDDEPEAEEPTVTDVPEPDQDDEEGEAEQDETAASEQEPEAIRSEKDIEKAFKKVQAENTRHSNRISEIMGEDAQALLPCELCSHFIHGFRLAVPIPPEIAERVLEAVGYAQLGKMKHSPYHEKCPTCDGMGEYLSWSMRADQRTLVCEDCRATGWRRRDDAPPLNMPSGWASPTNTAPNGEPVVFETPTMSESELKARMDAAVRIAKGE
jgi:rubrerythrin